MKTKADIRNELNTMMNQFAGIVTTCEPQPNGKRTVKAKSSRNKPTSIRPIGLPSSGSKIHRTIHPSRISTSGKIEQEYKI